MVARAGGYYWEAFMGARGVTQGDPLSPTIFNVVVDAVVRHWVKMALDEVEKRGERGKEGRHQAAPSKYSLYGIFYGTRVNACVRRLVHGAVFRVLKLNAQVSSR